VGVVASSEAWRGEAWISLAVDLPVVPWPYQLASCPYPFFEGFFARAAVAPRLAASRPRLAGQPATTTASPQHSVTAQHSTHSTAHSHSTAVHSVLCCASVLCCVCVCAVPPACLAASLRLAASQAATATRRRADLRPAACCLLLPACTPASCTPAHLCCKL
jgi:hypothetical protein